MIVRQIYKTENKNQLIINLSENFRTKKRILVVLDDSIDTKADKMDFNEKGSNRSIISCRRGYNF